ncbi:MAG TPA: histidine phosphatase family protein [Dehalococcoidia bacterium]|nr:histidine phosphatase family protein [Dehalococcoidia bacterium]
MRLVLIRHGETEHNRGQITLGRADVPLNDRGAAQARAVAASFVQRPDAIVSSPLRRALDTANGIGSAVGIAVAVDDRLIEMDVGEMEHLTGAELRERYPEFLGLWISGGAADARMPGGETLREVQDRAWAAVLDLQAGHPEGEVVAVTHNFVILTLICRAIALPLADFRRIRLALAAKTVIYVGERGATLLQLNDQSHLLQHGLAGDMRPRS